MTVAPDLGKQDPGTTISAPALSWPPVESREPEAQGGPASVPHRRTAPAPLGPWGLAQVMPPPPLAGPGGAGVGVVLCLEPLPVWWLFEALVLAARSTPKQTLVCWGGGTWSPFSLIQASPGVKLNPTCSTYVCLCHCRGRDVETWGSPPPWESGWTSLGQGRCVGTGLLPAFHSGRPTARDP